MVYRVYTEKKAGFSPEASGALSDFRSFLKISSLKDVRIINRYDVEGVSAELFEQAKTTVFSEVQLDCVCDTLQTEGARAVFAIEALPGQFDQRADSAAQCLQLISEGAKPLVKYAKVYMLYGDLSDEEVERIQKNVLNPVENRLADFELPETLQAEFTQPETVPNVEGFIAMDREQLQTLSKELGLAMDLDDLEMLRDYFKTEEHRDPTMTELRVVDTYWSDHCRHTTFATHIDHVQIEDKLIQKSYQRYQALRNELYGEQTTRPETLMDIATIGAKTLKKRGQLPELDVSDEINACSIHVNADVEGEAQDWLLMFKNETHNHPTEIEPFGGAATCIGGCIRDPLSGRVYVHQAMRITGSGDPRASLDATLPGKLPQRRIAVSAAAGYSGYGNQIGLATGLVDEIYHEGYIAKRLECGVTVGAAKADHVRRETPKAGDVVILLGGRTGRDGIGGATGSSKSHNIESLQTMASEVQKGNAPEERKIQRLFSNPECTRLIIRCNDFGAGGVSVAIGELADGLEIDLDAVRRKYEGLDGTELAISESQERMAVVVHPEDEERFIRYCDSENLEAYRVAVVTDQNRMIMNWKGQRIVDLSRDFLNTNGAIKHANVEIEAKDRTELHEVPYHTLRDMAGSLKTAVRLGLLQRFDSTVGARSLLMPLGGRLQRTPTQVMAALLPVAPGLHTETGSVMSYGFDPYRLSKDPYKGAYEAVYTSVSKLVASGADVRNIYLSFQEFFEKLNEDPKRWGKPFAALLGALDAQMELEIAAIGGKDSMSGSFMDLDVPPTLISFAIAPIKASEVMTSEFKAAGNPVRLFKAETPAQAKEMYRRFHELCEQSQIRSARAVEHGIAETVMKMSFGNNIGFDRVEQDEDWYRLLPMAIVAETDPMCTEGKLIGHTKANPQVRIGQDWVSIEELWRLSTGVLESVYPTKTTAKESAKKYTFHTEKKRKASKAFRTNSPLAIIPVFPGSNCEFDTASALIDAGARAEIVVLRNRTAEDIAWSVQAFTTKIKEAQMIVIPGGFSGGDEPEGSAKLIAAFFRNPAIKEAVHDLLDHRDGLILGICNGAQALIKLGLVPYGKIVELEESSPTLTFNVIGRHQSGLVRTRVASDLSPWLKELAPGDIRTIPVSHGEGRFVASKEVIRELAKNGQIATQYVDMEGNPTMEVPYNPNGSEDAIEGITSPDGRVLAKMGHSERIGKDLYRNVPAKLDMGLFRSAVQYFKEESE